MTKLIQIEQANFETEVLQSEQPVLVDFYADWCGPCRSIAPIVEELAGELDGQLKVAKLNADVNEDLMQKFGVFSIPTLILFHGGQEVERLVGVLPKPKLLETIRPYLGQTATA